MSTKIEATLDTLTLMRELFEADRQLKNAKLRMDTLRQQVMDQIGTGTVDLPNGIECRITGGHSYSIDRASLVEAAKDDPSILEGFSQSFSVSSDKAFDRLSDEQKQFVTIKPSLPTVKFVI